MPEPEQELEQELDILDLTEHELDELPGRPVVIAGEPSAPLPAPLGLAPADEPLAAAIRIAEAALDEVTSPERVGAFVDAVDQGDGVYALRFTTSTPGHTDWLWTVSMVRLEGEESPSVLECALLPSEGSLLAPAWIPWAERLAEYRATHDRHGNPLPAEGEDAEPGEDADGETAPAARTRSTARTRTRRRRRRDREAAAETDAGAEEPAAAEPAAEDAAAEAEPAPAENEPAEIEPAKKGAKSKAGKSKDGKPKAEKTKAEKSKGEKGEKPKGEKAAKSKAEKPKDGQAEDGAPKAAKGKDGKSKADKPKAEKSKREAPKASTDDELPVAADIREYADQMDDVLNGIDFEGDAG